MSENAIITRGMTRHFGSVKAVNDLDLTIKKGSIYGFLGPNGCGKSTSIRMLTGLLGPTSGEITVLGETLPAGAEALRRRIGYMTQKFSLYNNLSVRENLSFVGEVYGLYGNGLKRRMDDLIALYELGDFRHRFAETLSGGQRQRLALAAATIHEPDILFLDEPTSAVDPQNRREFWERLFDLSDAGKTILVSTHYMDEAERCHGLAILEKGYKRADGAPDALMRDMGATVVEVGGSGLRAIKAQLLTRPEVVSAAQLGSRLRVLVRDSISDPVQWLRDHIKSGDERSLNVVRPSLEDVFVSCTGKHGDDNEGASDDE